MTFINESQICFDKFIIKCNFYILVVNTNEFKIDLKESVKLFQGC